MVLRSRAFFFAATAVALAASNAEARGVAVVARSGSTDAAWTLAREIYSDPALRPSLDERRARVLAGEGVEGDDVRPLAELRAGVQGEDAASKQLLSAIADEVDAQAILLVSTDAGGKSSAREFVASSKSFDAAVYVAKGNDWPGVVVSLHKRWAPSPPVINAPAQQVREEKPGASSAKPFYLSPWFWGAIGAAVIGSLTLILATQDLSSDTIKLKLRVP